MSKTEQVDLQRRVVPLSKAVETEFEGLIYCVVLEPDSEDLQGDVLRFDTIQKAAHTFLSKYRVIGDSHVRVADAEVVESYVAPVDFVVQSEPIKKGSWVMTIKINDPELRSQVLEGEITGLSIGGVGERVGY